MSSSASVKFPAGRGRARPKTVPISAPVFAVTNRRVRCGVGDGGPCDKGNRCLSLGKLSDPSFPAPIDSMRAWSRATRTWCCHLFPALCRRLAAPVRVGEARYGKRQHERQRIDRQHISEDAHHAGQRDGDNDQRDHVASCLYDEGDPASS
ncbi:hypothetical protein OCA5_c15910 [Afipia carboxidovorans OM5]|uniref:Uncharacterized protein n=1 Tax=Afipia carboxidovorans (strain ATCC 49405 / DSM 1227 / KCTC 32145 / OM5) TaxID=504832 RepID=F8BZU6_AFIC5|nr:hypothetical protein OCA4_c15910 [Afipia carboxidovorans OM4]AEI06305.1 hypothetical protein OCA5_c15910 [Afipia carboxidovorans OM5]